MYEESVEFLNRFFHYSTKHPIEIRALPNERGAAPAKAVFTREGETVVLHCERFDKPGRGVFFGVCTRKPGSHTGKKEDASECPAVWVDIDLVENGMDRDATQALISGLFCPPSVLVNSGRGLHAYWLLNEGFDVSDRAGQERVETVLRQLAGISGGDPSVAEVARIMRLPGTTNSKQDPLLCSVIEFTERRYELDDIEEWLSWQLPVIAPAPGAVRAAVLESDPFMRAAGMLGWKPPLDVEQALSGMQLGAGASGVHAVQLSVSASLAAAGKDDAEILALLMARTREAVGLAGEGWNWKREEAGIRAMIASARKKFAVRGSASSVGGVGPAQVVSLKAVRQERTVAKAERGLSEQVNSKDEIVLLGESVIAVWQEERGPLIIVDGELWTYAEGIWTVFDHILKAELEIEIQRACKALGKSPKSGLLNNVFKYIERRPELGRKGVRWNKSGLIVCLDGAIDPMTLTMVPLAPEHYATYRIEARVDTDLGLPIRWLSLLDSGFGNLEPDPRAEVIACLQEWFGSALIRGKTRELTKALFIIGESRTGKSQLAFVLRALIGGKPCALNVSDLEDGFGMQPLLTASAWIADDAISHDEFLDPEKFKQIVTGEPRSIRRKNQPSVEASLDMPVCLTSNHLPRVKDQSDAVYNRVLILPMGVEFPEDEGEAIIEPLWLSIVREELGAVLLWSLAGWQRVRARGRFKPPLLMTKANRELKEANNPVGVWAGECVEREPSLMVDRRDLVASFRGWWLSEYSDAQKPFSPKFIIGALRRITKMEAKKNGGWRYEHGIKLTKEGLNYVELMNERDLGKKAGSGKVGVAINQIKHADTTPETNQTNTTPESIKTRFPERS